MWNGIWNLAVKSSVLAVAKENNGNVIMTRLVNRYDLKLFKSKTYQAQFVIYLGAFQTSYPLSKNQVSVLDINFYTCINKELIKTE